MPSVLMLSAVHMDAFYTYMADAPVVCGNIRPNRD